MSVKVESLDLGTYKIDYFQFGTGEKTMVILPGLSLLNVTDLADTIAVSYGSFADDYTVYLFEKPDLLPEKFNVHDLAEDTVKAFAKLGLKDLYLFGASLGGMMALDIALNHISLVKRVCVASVPLKVASDMYAKLLRWIWLARVKDGISLCSQMCKDVYPGSVYNSMKDDIVKTGRALTEDDFYRFIMLASAAGSFDFSEDFKKLKCAVSVALSEDDMLLGDSAVKQYMDFSQKNRSVENPGFKCDLVIYGKGSGHALYDVAPDFKTNLYEFFMKGNNKDRKKLKAKKS